MIGGLFMRTTTRRLLAACATLAMLLSGLALSGCAQRALWSDEDTGAMRKLSYWDGQSVERERRRGETTQTRVSDSPKAPPTNNPGRLSPSRTHVGSGDYTFAEWCWHAYDLSD